MPRRRRLGANEAPGVAAATTVAPVARRGQSAREWIAN